MTPGPFGFRPPWWGVVLAAAGCAAGIALGNWQSDRAAQKRAAGAAVEQVALRGEWVPKYTVLLDNKVYRGRPGYQVVQPLRIAGEKYVLVNRGWVAASARREQLPEIRTPAGEVVLSGVRRERFAHSYAPVESQPGARVWQNVTVEQFAAWSGLPLESYVIEQHSALDDGLVRDWPRADLGIEMHESYALQWYSLAALCVVFLFALNIRREKPRI
jgi:surfeit locus 1 family protein